MRVVSVRQLKKNYRKVLSTWFVLVMFTQPVLGETLHLILCATDDDGTMMESCRNDLLAIKRLFGKIAAGLNYWISIKEFCADELEKGKATDALTQLDFQPNDMIVFWYSDHRIPSTDKTGNHRDTTIQSELLRIRQILTEQDARLALMGADITDRVSESHFPLEYEKTDRAAKSPNLLVLRRIIEEFNGNITFTTCESCGTAWRNDDGGLLTSHFTSELEKAIHSPTEDGWSEIIASTESIIRRQTELLDANHQMRLNVLGIQAFGNYLNKEPFLEVIGRVDKRAKTEAFWRGLVGDLDAAILDADKKTAYFFKGNAYYDFNVEADKCVFSGTIQEKWRGLPSHIDAAATAPNRKGYFFKGDKYYCVNWQSHDVEHKGNISEISAELPSNLDAAMTFFDGKTYFFKGNRFYRFDWEHRKVDNVGRINNGSWDKGFPDLDAALHFANERVYFFKGGEYQRIVY